MLNRLSLLFIATLALPSFAMSRLCNVVRTKIAHQVIAPQSLFKRTITKLPSSIQSLHNPTFFRIKNVQKPKPVFNRACTALAGAVGLATATLTLSERQARAESKKSQASLKEIPWQALKDQKVKELKAEEHELHKKILEYCGINEEEWKKEVDHFLKKFSEDFPYRKAIMKQYSDFMKPFSANNMSIKKSFLYRGAHPELKACIEKSLNESGINSNKVVIMVLKHPNPLLIDYVGVAPDLFGKKLDKGSSIVLIGQEWNSLFHRDASARKELTGIFAHEVQHLLNNDSIERLALAQRLTTSYYKNLKKNPTELYGLFFSYAQFQEKRADIMGCLEGPEKAAGQAAFFARKVQLQKNLALITPMHPDTQKRYDLCIDLYNKMKSA